MIKIFFLLIILPFCLNGQQSTFIDSCNYLRKSSEFDRLRELLEKKETTLKDTEFSDYYFYKSIVAKNDLDKESQLKYLLIGLDFINSKDSLFQAQFLDQLALVYKTNGDGYLEEAVNYIDESIVIKKQLDDLDELAESFIIKGNIFYKARFRKSRLDTALYYYELAKSINSRERNHYLILSAINTILVNKNENLDSVEINYKYLIDYYKGNSNFKSAANLTNSLASFYRKQARFQESQIIYDTLLNYVTLNKWKTLKNSILTNMYKLSEAKGDYKKALALKDSLYSIKYNDFKQSLNKVEKEHENEKLKLDIEKASATTYKNRLWLSVLGGTTGTLCLFLFGMYKYFSLKRQKVEEALEAAKIRAAFDATKAKMEGELKERESIASVLHDQVASLLTAADLHLNVASKKDPTAPGITKAVGLIRDINNHVRDLSHQLVSPALIKFGLEAGIDSMIERMENSNLHITYVSKLEDRRYSSSLEAFIFQSASEFLHNVMKHSTATQAKLYITEENGKILLSVSDNGDNSHVSPKASTGLGLTHINARAAALGGHFSFTLKPNGAVSLLEVPVEGVE